MTNRLPTTHSANVQTLDIDNEAIERVRYVDAGMARFAEILQSLNADAGLELWARQLLESLAEYLDLLQAALYVVEKNEDEQNPFLRPAGAYACLLENLPQKIEFGEGAVGQAALSRRIFETDQNSRFQAKAASGLGKVLPRSVMVLPLVNEKQETLGALEIAVLQKLKPAQKAFLERLCQNLAAALTSLRNQQKIIHLYEIARQKEQEIRQMNAGLDQMVQERTAELQVAIENLRDTQQQLVQSEKMASLGQLIAGVAHEINTPIGAIKAAATNIGDILPQLLTDSNTLIPSLPVEVRELIQQMASQMRNGKDVLSAREERKLKRAHIGYLEENGVENGDYLVESLVGAGFYEDVAPYITLFKHPEAARIIQYVIYQGQLVRNLSNISLASDKTKKVVFALKNYSHTQQADDLAPVNLQENIEMVLILYHNQLKMGIQVITHFEDTPPIIGNADELGQVWTNIIHNAAQAMDYSGSITVELKNLGNLIQVRLADTGPGIPPEIQQKIFEPFFTTKKRGEGTGLGLDICRKIIEKHNGVIRLQSVPGCTEFFIEFPMPQNV